MKLDQLLMLVSYQLLVSVTHPAVFLGSLSLVYDRLSYRVTDSARAIPLFALPLWFLCSAALSILVTAVQYYCLNWYIRAPFSSFVERELPVQFIYLPLIVATLIVLFDTIEDSSIFSLLIILYSPYCIVALLVHLGYEALLTYSVWRCKQE